LFTAADFTAYLRRAGALGDEPVPAGVIICYQRSLYDHVLRTEGLPGRVARRLGLLPMALPTTGGRVGLLGQFGIGAPAATTAVEQLAALGTSAVVSIGTAGSLQHDLEPGDLVLCEAAIRDEGVSHHYLPPGRLAMAPAPMSAALGAAMTQSGLRFRSGVSWTIDTPYRETIAEIRHYQAEGVLCVEMEAAALFAVAQVRGLQLASAFVISDSLADLAWNPGFHDPQVEAGLVELYRAAVTALTAGR
jgi:uridine phosphorylase